MSAPRVLTRGALCAAGQTAGAAGCACFPPRSVFQNPMRPERGASCPRARPCARHTRVFKILSAPRVLTCGALCAAGQTAGAAGCACFPPRSVFQNPARPDVRGALRCMTECTGHGFIPRLPRDAPLLRFSKPHAPRARGELPAPGHAPGIRGLFWSFVRPCARPCARHTRVFRILSAPRVLTCGALCAAGRAGHGGLRMFSAPFHFSEPHTS